MIRAHFTTMLAFSVLVVAAPIAAQTEQDVADLMAEFDRAEASGDPAARLSSYRKLAAFLAANSARQDWQGLFGQADLQRDIAGVIHAMGGGDACSALDKSAAFLRQSRTALEQIKAEGTYDVIDDIGRQNALARQISADRQKMGCTAPAPLVDVGNPDEVLEGHYYLSGVMETGSELLLKSNGQFEWFISYGAVDQMAKGRWGRSGEIVTLAVDPQAKDKPLFRADEVFPWDEAAERFRWEQERDRQEDQIAARCPWNRSSTETLWSFDLEETPPPDDAQRERASSAKIAAEAARDKASRMVALAVAANANDADRAAASAAMEAWHKARDDMAEAHYVANLPEPDIGEPAKPPACQPLPVENYVPIPEAEWRRGVAIMLGDPERGLRFHDVAVTFVFSDGHREASETRTRGLAFAPMRADATVNEIELRLKEPVERTEVLKITPMTDGIQAVIVDTQQISEPAFEVLRLMVEDGDLIPENMPRGRYSRH